LTKKSETEREKELFEESLRENDQLAEDNEAELPAGATHRAVTTEDGAREIRRERFSAF
jgi:hypothetical protein